MQVHRSTFLVMGTTANLTLVGSGRLDLLADLAESRLRMLQARWSRFEPESELSVLGRTGHQVVSEDTLALVLAMQDAWKSTSGLFDPTVRVDLAGYDRDWAAMPMSSPAAAFTWTSSMGAVLVDEEASTVTLPAGVTLDPGAIGKGLAADWVLADFKSVGVEGALVDIGGDLTFFGHSPADFWTISVADEDHFDLPDASDLLVLEYPNFVEPVGVATSSTRRRRWTAGHHVIDVHTGLPTVNSISSVTVSASSACLAEVHATAAMQTSVASSLQRFDDLGLHGLIVSDQKVWTNLTKEYASC